MENEKKQIFIMAYKSKFTGAYIDERLELVKLALGATDELDGVEGLIPAPPGGGTKRVLFGDMTWDNLYTKVNGSILQITPGTVSSDDLSGIMGGVNGFNATYDDIKAGKNVVLNLIGDDGDGPVFQAYQAIASINSTEGKTIVFYIDGTEFAISLSPDNTFSINIENRKEIKTVDVSIFEGDSGTLSDDNYQTIVDAYETRSMVARYVDSHVPMVIGFDSDNDQYNITITLMVGFPNYYRVLYLQAVVKTDKTYTISQSSFDITHKYLQYLGFMCSTKTVNTLQNLPSGHNIIANVTAATDLSVGFAMIDGTELQVRVNNTTASDIVQTLPNTGNYQSMYGTSVTIPANSFIELNIWYIGGKYVIRVGENS